MKKFDVAQELINQSIEMFQETDCKVDLAKSYLHAAQCSMSNPEMVLPCPDVEALLKESIEIFASSQAFYLEKEAHYSLVIYED